MRRLLIIAFGLFIGGAVIALSPATVLAQDGERAASGANNARQGQNGVNPQISNMPATQTETDEAIERSGGNPGPELTPFVPRLSVPIAGVQFTTPTIVDGKVQVPFLAQYITGIYRYALAISTIIGIIVIIIGGFYYLVGASTGDVKRGQALITDAVIGLFALYTATFVLNFINPNLTNLRPLALSSIDAQSYDYEPTGSTFESSDHTTPVDDGGGGTQRNLNGSGGGNAAPLNATCPFNDLPEGHTARRQMFDQRVASVLRQQDPLARTAEAASLAASCSIFYGSCNDHATAYRRLAGAANRSFSVSNGPDRRTMNSIALNIRCKHRQTSGCQVTNAEGHGREARDIFRQRANAQGITPQEFNRYADSLQPGHWVYMYNGNIHDGHGMHSAIFVGWVDGTPRGTSGRARMVEGWSADGIHPSRFSTYCIRPSCSADYFPITVIH